MSFKLSLLLLFFLLVVLVKPKPESGDEFEISARVSFQFLEEFLSTSTGKIGVVMNPLIIPEQ